MLRAMENSPFALRRSLPVMNNKNDFEALLNCIRELYINQKTLISADELGFKRWDTLLIGHDFMIYKVTEYVIRTKRQTHLWITILEELIANDIRIAFYLTELYLSQDKVKDAMNLLAKALIDYPLCVPLLIK
jgi:hypothetical protein